MIEALDEDEFTPEVFEFVVTVQISSATRDLMLIQHNKFYCISNRSGVAELIWTIKFVVGGHIFKRFLQV